MQVSVNESMSKLTIELPIALRPSKSGKTTLVASSGGNQTTSVVIDGKPVTVGVNAYIPK